MPCESETVSANSAQELPTARLRPERRLSLAWFIPLFALALAGWLAYRAWTMRGSVIDVQFDQGYGLKPGDEVRYLGVRVGEVRELIVADDMQSITARLALSPNVDQLRRAGTRFWIVHPQLGLGAVEGLETLVGPRYIAVLPGDGVMQNQFVGLVHTPLIEHLEPGDLEIILESPVRAGLRAGAPVLYRQIRIGTILSAGLTSDAGAVEARLYIDKAYAPLIRENTIFWPITGIETSIGLTGVRISLESLESVVVGGVAMATPSEAGDMVTTDHRFTMQEQPDDEWMEWEPLVALGSSLLPPGAPLPHPYRVKLTWKQGRLFSNTRSLRGWALQTNQGLLAPRNLLQPSDKAQEQSAVIEIAGQTMPLNLPPRDVTNDIALLEAQIVPIDWPQQRMRRPEAPEECIIVADPFAEPLPLDESRLTMRGDRWFIDPAVSLDESLHGAAIVARSDGMLVGLLVFDDDEDTPFVALLPADA